MLINVKVYTGSKEAKVVEGNPMRVYLTEPPVQGRANRELVEVLERYFGRPVRIVKGHKSRLKVVFVDERQEGSSREVHQSSE